MRHGKKINHLSRKVGHRKSMLANMACSLIESKRINTTVPKAKALRKYVESLITKSKTDTSHSRRVVFSYLRNKHAVTELFSTISDKIIDRPGGYTRILKTGFRQGDNAKMCLIELVDFFNDIYGKEAVKKTRRSRRGGKKNIAETTKSNIPNNISKPTDTKSPKKDSVTDKKKIDKQPEKENLPKAVKKIVEKKEDVSQTNKTTKPESSKIEKDSNNPPKK